VLTHRYGREGRELKKFEDKCLLFDFECLQKLSEKSFIDQYSIALDTFAIALDKEVNTGNTKIIHFKFFFQKYTTFFSFLDFSSFSSISDVKSFPVCTISTTDPAINIHLQFEVNLLNKLSFSDCYLLN
jgi:hypothetical protein